MTREDFTLTDHSVMTFGIHKGVMLKDIPASYLLWCLDNLTEYPAGLYNYLITNQDALLAEKSDE